MMIDMVMKVLATFFVVIAFAIILEIPGHLLIYAGIVGAAAQIAIYIAGMYSRNETLKVFMGALAIALISHLFARALKAPATIFLVAGILPIVPGEAIYRAVYYFIRDNQSMVNKYFSKTLTIAGAIALAIFIMDSIFMQLAKRKLLPDIKGKKKKKKTQSDKD